MAITNEALATPVLAVDNHVLTISNIDEHATSIMLKRKGQDYKNLFLIKSSYVNVTGAESCGMIAVGDTVTVSLTADGTNYKLPETPPAVTGATSVYSRTSDTVATLTITDPTDVVQFTVEGVLMVSTIVADLRKLDGQSYLPYSMTIYGSNDPNAEEWDTVITGGGSGELTFTTTYHYIKLTTSGNGRTYSTGGGVSLYATIGQYSDIFYVASSGSISYHVDCLTGDMEVTLSDNSTKRLDQLDSTDTYLSYDFTTGQVISNVAPLYFDAKDGHSGKFCDHYQRYTFSDGTIIKEVHKHRFFNMNHMEFINLCDWEIGDKIYKLDGSTPQLISKEIVNEPVEHFTVTTKHFHNGFVQGCLYGDRYAQRYKVVNNNGVLVYDQTSPHDYDYLYGPMTYTD